MTLTPAITVKLYRVLKRSNRFESAPSRPSNIYPDIAPRTFHEMSKKARLSAVSCAEPGCGTLISRRKAEHRPFACLTGDKPR